MDATAYTEPCSAKGKGTAYRLWKSSGATGNICVTRADTSGRPSSVFTAMVEPMLSRLATRGGNTATTSMRLQSIMRTSVAPCGT
jgi:hypothetical protein